MKKLLCVFLAAVILLSLTACGGITFLGREQNYDKNAAAGKVETIAEAAPFSDGVAIVVNHSDKRHETKFCVIDKEGNILGELDLEDYNLFNPVPHGYINGVLVYRDKVYDKTGKIIASPEKSGYTRLLTDARCDGKILAVKVEETASGNKLSYGVLDREGNWIEPLSDTHPIAKAVENLEEDKINLYITSFCTDKIVCVADNCYYDMVAGEMRSSIGEFFGKEGNGERHEVYYRDTEGNERKIKGGVYLRTSLEEGFIGCYSQNDDRYLNQYYFDQNGNEMVNLNTNDVMDARVIDGYLFVLRELGQNKFDTCVYETNGEKVIESLPVKSHFNDLQVWPDYRIFSIDEHTFYNFDGEKIEFEGYMTAGFGDGLFYVVSKDDYHRAFFDMNGNRVL